MDESRIREINDVSHLLSGILSEDYDHLSIYERLAIRYLIIQLVEASTSICVELSISYYGETAEGYPDCLLRLGGSDSIGTIWKIELSCKAKKSSSS